VRPSLKLPLALCLVALDGIRPADAPGFVVTRLLWAAAAVS
jgi:hypothetical protein